MTRFLKLVRYQDNQWMALPTENDDLSQLSLKERKYAPIDPAQLLKALDSLLSPEGGIRSSEDVKKIASLMKKFSKKLVSRCVYCNVLQATKTDILSEYLEEGGWETINTWLQYAKSSSSHSFLLEMLKLCNLLPMTLARLKENNTAKVIKSLTKHESSEVKTLSSELVNKWMSIIKGNKANDLPSGEKKKKKVKSSKEEESKKEEKESPKITNDKRANHKHIKEKHVPNDKLLNEKEENEKLKSDTELIRSVARLKGTKRTSSEKDQKKTEYYEDVKIDPEPLYPIPKKPRPDRPKTAKVYQKNFRSTGLEEATPLPKNIVKKTNTVDKSAVVAAKIALTKVNQPAPDRIIDKKIKPESLLAINENASSGKGIKLIPAKPRPVLQESASFMDALCQQPGPPMKRKKKVPPNKASLSPTSPTLVPPKLQFYKDTLEMNEENKEESPEKEKSPTNETKLDEGEAKVELNESMEITEEGGHTPPNSEIISSSPKESTEETKDESHENSVRDPNQLRSILAHGRRRGKKKTVRWVEDHDLKEIFYFEMDETERVNVLRTQNFCDMKTNEVKREREAMEMAKRQAGDRMEESTRWWIVPITIDLPPPIVEVGFQSKEKETERMRQQSSLQEIYFTREMIPDSPREPDLEIVPAVEPKIIPLDEDNQIGVVMDYSKYEPPVTSLPEVLTSLIMNTSRPILQAPPQNFSPEHLPFDTNLKLPLLNSENLLNHLPALSMQNSYHKPAEPVTSNSLLPHQQPLPPSLLGIPPVNDVPTMVPPPPHDWRPSEEMNQMNQPDNYYRNFPMNSGPMDPMPMNNMNMRPPMMQDMPNMYRPQNMSKGPRGPRRGRVVVCRHFAAGGCRYGSNCTFLHPGINGPLL